MMNHHSWRLVLIVHVIVMMIGCSGVSADINSRDHDERRLGVLELLGDRSPETIQYVTDFLQDEDELVRAAAVRVLGDSKDPLLYPHIAPLLKDANDTVRMSACRAVREISQKEQMIADMIMVANGDASPYIRLEALGILSHFHQEDTIIDACVTLIDDHEAKVAFRAHQILLKCSGRSESEQSHAMWSQWNEMRRAKSK